MAESAPRVTEFLWEQVELLDEDAEEERYVPTIGAAVESEEKEPEIIDLFGDGTAPSSPCHRRVWAHAY